MDKKKHSGWAALGLAVGFAAVGVCIFRLIRHILTIDYTAEELRGRRQ